MNKLLLAGAAGAALIGPSAASAAVTVIGSGYARACYEAAEYAHSARSKIVECDKALTEEALTRRDRAATHVNRGILRMRMKELPRALADYDASLAIKPDTAEAHVNKGIALIHIGGRDGEAIASISRGLELRTSRPEVAYYTRGMANELVGNSRAAYDDYRQAATLKPDWDAPTRELRRFAVVRKPG